MKASLVLWGLLALFLLLVPLTAIPLSQETSPLPAAASSREAGPPPSSAASSSPAAERGDAAPAAEAGVFYGAPSSFRILNETTGQVEEVPVRDYVRGAVAAEMPALYHPEALKAQAVAAYTYGVRSALDHRETPLPSLQGADFSADPHNLKGYITEEEARTFYGDQFDGYWSKVCQAADEVLGYLLLDPEGNPVAAAYHAISAGTTEDAANIWDGAIPCLTPVESPGDLLAHDYETTAVFSSQEMALILAGVAGADLSGDPAGWIQVAERSSSGYVTQVLVGGVPLHGQQLRTLLGLRSTAFDLAVENGTFSFIVRGYGHGAGLSQNGADYMARQGATFDQILAHYYPDSQLAMAAGEE